MSKIYDAFNGVINGDKKIKIFAAIGIIAILLILLSEFIPTATESKNKEETDYAEYISSLENETQELLSSISGAGRCKVMITLKNSSESVYAKNTEEKL